MGKNFSVDANLKDTPDDPRYIFWAIQEDNYKAFRYAISKEEFKSNPNLIYEGEGEEVDWKFNPLIHCCYKERVKMCADLMNNFSDILDVNYHSKNEHEWTALLWAIEKNNESIVDILLRNDRIDHTSIYDNKGRSAMDLSEDRNYWNLNMKFILRDLTEGRQSLVTSEQHRHEEEDAVGAYIKELFANNIVGSEKEIQMFKKILFEICKHCIVNRKPIDSTLYIVAYEISNDYEKNEFCDIILNVVDQILDNKISNKLQTGWLKKYLLPCCIWQKKYYEPCEKPMDAFNEGTDVDAKIDGDNTYDTELNKLRMENKRLKKIMLTIKKAVNKTDVTSEENEDISRMKKMISNIKELTNYELSEDSTVVDDILNQLDGTHGSTKKKKKKRRKKHKKNAKKKAEPVEITTSDVLVWNSYLEEYDAEPNTASQLQSFVKRKKLRDSLSYKKARQMLMEFGGKGTLAYNNNKIDNTTDESHETRDIEEKTEEKDDGEIMKSKDDEIVEEYGDKIKTIFREKFDRDAEYAKELMYFSRTVSDIPDLTLIQAQTIYGGMVYITSEQEEQRLKDAIERPIMFEKLLEITRSRDYEESQHLKANLQKYVDGDNDGLQTIKSIPDYKLTTDSDEKIIIRQDSNDLIGNGLLLDENEINLSELRALSNEEVGFNAEKYFTRYIYTHRLLLLSNELNEAYQNTICDIFENINPYSDKVKVLPGPIKKAGRVIEKSETKYKNQSFPVAAKVLDTLRCSVVFNQPNDLKKGIEWFINYVQQNKNDDEKKKDEDDDEKLGFYHGATGKIINIVRSKNMFTDVEVNWDVNNPGYADLKYNVLFEFYGKQIITEIQFLISEMMATKKKIHGFYSILRYEDIFRVLHLNMSAITPKRKFSVLIRTKENCDINAVKDLMITFGFHGSNILIDDNWMRYGLHFAAEYGNYELMKLLLMPQDVDINIADRFGQTPLHQACYAGEIKIIKMILNNMKINVKQLNNDGQQAIHFQHGAAAGYKNIEILKLLVDGGCNPCIQDNVNDECMNVFHRLCLASKNDDLLENIKLILDIQPRYEYDLKEIKHSLNTKDAKGNTPIYYASEKEKNNIQIEKLLKSIL